MSEPFTVTEPWMSEQSRSLRESGIQVPPLLGSQFPLPPKTALGLGALLELAEALLLSRLGHLCAVEPDKRWYFVSYL
jgi:hypothetical protein